MTKLRLTDFDLRLSYTATAVIRRYIAPTQPCHFGPWSWCRVRAYAGGEAGVTNAMSA